MCGSDGGGGSSGGASSSGGSSGETDGGPTAGPKRATFSSAKVLPQVYRVPAFFTVALDPADGVVDDIALPTDHSTFIVN